MVISAVNSSHDAVVGLPPIIIPLTDVPVPIEAFLAVAILLISVQDVPFHASVLAVLLDLAPPAINALALVPAPPEPVPALFKSFTSVQLVPSYTSALS